MYKRQANEIASEHMEIVTRNPFEDMMKVRNAGAIFIGQYLSLIHIFLAEMLTGTRVDERLQKEIPALQRKRHQKHG